MSIKKRPCILGLKEFEKTGCPQKSWSADNPDGCPAWKKLVVSERGNPLKKTVKEQCILEWQFEFQWSMLGLLEGNQEAIESFRNGMVDKGPNGKSYPKPDPAMITLLNTIERNLRKNLDKQIDNQKSEEIEDAR